MGKPNPELKESLKLYSASKYGRPRKDVGLEIRRRLGAGDAAKQRQEEEKRRQMEERMNALRGAEGGIAPSSIPENAATPKPISFLDSWVEKKKQLEKEQPQTAVPASQPSTAQPQPEENIFKIR